MQQLLYNWKRLFSLIFFFGVITTGYILLFHLNKDNTKSRLLSNKVSRPRSIEKPSVLLFVGVVSAPLLILRRNALRNSWFSQCKGKDVACWIFTDSQDVYGKKLLDSISIPLKHEQNLHGDLILAQSPGGVNFARRYLWIAQWANERYKFKFFLRVDDDYFICMDRLLLELPQRPKEKLYWGFIHCDPPGGIRVDEGFLIVTNDLVQHFLREQNNTLMCHPYGDQAIAMWINDIPGVTYFGDPRVYHTVSKVDRVIFTEDPGACETVLALHQSYPVETEKLWKRHLSSRKVKEYRIPEISYPCEDQNKTLNYNIFVGKFHSEPVLCKNLPIWNIAGHFPGRSQPRRFWDNQRSLKRLER